MSSPSTTSSLTLPGTKHTAPVLEFECLYTHDIRRKQKRWQDGVLRFHTFNKRVMVYDIARNFVGDTHWRESAQIAENDEFQLELGGALVQIGAPTGQAEQDLTGLLEKRVKEREQRQSNRNSNAISASPKAARGLIALSPKSCRQTQAQSSQWRPKSLAAVLGTTRGPTGRALSTNQSPFELQSLGKDNGVLARPTKLQKVRHHGSIPSARDVTVKAPLSNALTSIARTGTKTTNVTAGADQETALVISEEELNAHGPVAKAPRQKSQKSRRKPRASQEGPSMPSRADADSTLLPTNLCHSPASDSKSPNQEKTYCEPPSNPLRFAPRKARNKLLCQEAPTLKLSSDATASSHDDALRTNNLPGSATNADDLTVFHEGQRARIQARLRQRQRTQDTAQRTRDASSNHKPKSDETLAENCSFEEEPPPVLGPVPISIRSISVRSFDPAEQLEKSLSPSHVSAEYPSRFREREANESLFVTQSEFNGVEMDSTADIHIPDKSSNVGLEQPSVMSKLLPQPDALQQPTSLSGPTTNDAASNMPGPQAMAPPPPDSGPWSREALDLFSWWPPGREVDRLQD
ncbi:MAG: hypothetical protein M1833_006792 [Piccolia ochrophora]|nr:MAG: hypothetical protein M1833_006792 [Piccolia ochrophora]